MKRAALAALGALLLASGCQNTQKSSAPGNTSPMPGSTSQAAASAAASVAPSPVQASPSLAPTPTPAPVPAAKLYKINKNYDFVPIDPNAGTPTKVVLLTFDDGPKDRAVLTSMLDTLDKHHAKAIFFVNGYRVKQNPDLLKLIHERKQTIGNHSWDHIDLKKESNAKIDQQIGDVQAKVQELTGASPRFFRPPFGSGSDYVREKAVKEKLLYMTWSNGSLDWDTKTSDKPKEVIENVMKQLHPGSNILMHELAWTSEALDSLLTQLEGKGYGFVDPATIELVD
ncbi:polysaccharide deacetylase family protein [Gorillibacterium sp. sgz5001074]|uniref:polysaccharide deacetylase family protein n=1 Tax=Gorillibacterium sp. sgz5001074 TaxID=3446695 RepID=UPI003F663D9C